jgi:hypothetical protein
MIFLIAGLPPAFLVRLALREETSGRPVDRDAVSRRHCFISMVEEPTKTLRGALAFFRGASCQNPN